MALAKGGHPTNAHRLVGRRERRRCEVEYLDALGNAGRRPDDGSEATARVSPAVQDDEQVLKSDTVEAVQVAEARHLARPRSSFEARPVEPDLIAHADSERRFIDARHIDRE